MASRSLSGDQRGFTIIEVLVAATLLVIGVLGTMAMVDSSNAETRLSGGREGATNLAREVVEGARTLGYDELLPASVNTRLQTLPGLTTTTPGSWTVKRRGVVYTISTSLCSIDDPKDGYGSHAGATYCADSATTGTADAQPEDFKRLTVDVSWAHNARTNRVRQVAQIESPATKGPRITSLVAPGVANPSAPKITSASVTTVSFKATALTGVASVTYSLDGVDKGQAVKAANGTDWTFDISLAGLSDGGYDVSVRATDSRDVVGPAFTIPMTLIRGAPAAPSGLVGGPNTIYVNGAAKAVTELEWKANAERNVIGYRVYNENGTLVCPGNAQTLSLQLSCVDMANLGWTYTVKALYRDASDVVTEGPGSTINTPRTYVLKNTDPGSVTNCGATPIRDMVQGFQGLDPEASFVPASGGTINFCSAPFSAAKTLTVGDAKANLYLENKTTTTAKTDTCTVQSKLFRSGNATALTPPANHTVPPNTPVSLSTGLLSSVPAQTLAAGERLNLVLTWGTTSGCSNTFLHFGGTTYRSSLTMPPATAAPPNPPTGLSATTLADGTTQLSWVAPAGGSAASFYRIYRDGVDYTNRLDSTGSATETTYVDDPGGTTHTYYVTAVSDNLAESTKTGPVTK